MSINTVLKVAAVIAGAMAVGTAVSIYSKYYYVPVADRNRIALEKAKLAAERRELARVRAQFTD